MGLIKSVTGAVSKAAAEVVGGAIEAVGEVTNSNFIKDVGKGVNKATVKTGEIVGNLADGTYDAIGGLITDDKQQAKRGYKEILGTVQDTATTIGKGIVHVSEKGVETVQAIREGDTDKAIEAGKELAKVAAVGVFSVGVIDIIDGVDGIADGVEGDSVAQASAPEAMDVEYAAEENPNTHHVTPHERVLPDGRTIWVDGDGDTSVNTQGGWEQHNPDYRIPKV